MITNTFTQTNKNHKLALLIHAYTHIQILCFYKNVHHKVLTYSENAFKIQRKWTFIVNTGLNGPP